MERDTAIRIAVIGQGFMGRAHSLAWSRAAHMAVSALRPELTVLCGRDRVALSFDGRDGGPVHVPHRVANDGQVYIPCDFKPIPTRQRALLLVSGRAIV